MIDFYTANTPNGLRVELMLEELELPYTRHVLSLSQGDTHSAEFLKLNPSARIPVIIDHYVPNGEPLVLTQSVAILLYLAEKTGEFLSIAESSCRAKCMEWLLFDASDIATTRFDAFYLSRRQQAPAAKALQERVMEYYRVYDQQLAVSHYLAGDEYSVADIAAYPWARAMQHPQMTVLTHLQRWMACVEQRPAVQKIVNNESS